MSTSTNGQALSSIAFDDTIPKRGPELFIKRLAAGEVKHYTAWGTRIRGIWIHWNGSTGKSEPHYEENCKACSLGMSKRWKGFLHCYCTEDKAEQFLEFTPGSAEALLAQLADPSDLRGAIFKARRTQARNGRLQISMLAPIQDPRFLPKEKDPRRSILKLWGVPDSLLPPLAEGDGQAVLEGESDPE